MPNQPTLRDVIREETRRCMEDPVYFMRKYVKIQHPNKGTIPFDLYPFQEDALNEFDYRYLLILKSRQLGITTLVAAYSLWMSIFNSDKNILIISIKQEVSKEIITKVTLNDNIIYITHIISISNSFSFSCDILLSKKGYIYF